jgi:cellobiose phosphorylase
VRENGGQYTHAAIWAAMAFAALDDKPRAWELFSMINPVNHSKSAERIAAYKVEPYRMPPAVMEIGNDDPIPNDGMLTVNGFP